MKESSQKTDTVCIAYTEMNKDDSNQKYVSNLKKEGNWNSVCNLNNTEMQKDNSNQRDNSVKYNKTEKYVCIDDNTEINKDSNKQYLSNVKKEENWNSMWLVDNTEIKNSNNDNFASNFENVNERISLKVERLDEAGVDGNTEVLDCGTQNVIKRESAVLTCVQCFKEFVHNHAYNEHMSMHDQMDGTNGCDSTQVLEPCAAGDWNLKKQCMQKVNAASTSAPAETIVASKNTMQERQEPSAQKTIPTVVVKPEVLNENAHMSTDIDVNQKPFFCDICNYTCATIISLARHKRIHDGVIPTKATVIIKTEDMNAHMSTDTDNQYSCDKCDYKCAFNSYLTRHMRTHTGEKPFSCDMCNYTCATKSSLFRHKRTHDGVRAHACKICDYKCAQANHLIIHMRIHTGEKPFTCETCGYKTTQKSRLLVHMRTHTGEKPFSCDKCSYKAAIKRSMDEHMRTHTGEKPYVCESCDYSCSQYSSFLTHRRIHTGEKPFSCGICSYRTAICGELTKHVRKHKLNKT